MKHFNLIYFSLFLSVNVYAFPIESIKSIHVNDDKINKAEIKNIYLDKDAFIDQIELKKDYIYYASEIEKVVIKFKEQELSIPGEIFKISPPIKYHHGGDGYLFSKLEGDGSGGG